MKQTILPGAEKYSRARQRRKHWYNLVACLGVAVVFCTIYALTQPAITLEKEIVCGLTEHTHTEACYETTHVDCTPPETEGHTHTADCYQKVLACETGEAPAHQHDASCEGLPATLVCTQDHTHVGTCYTYEPGLVCGLSEDGGHTHDDSCYQTILACDLEEAESHTHDDSCRTATTLTCPLPEHTHTDDCYLPPADNNADLETRDIWEASLSAAELTGSWPEDLVSIARTQLGYTESKTNYISTEDGHILHYTRYGQWYGMPYGDWDAMFVSFCLHYAGVEGIEPEQDAAALLDALNAAELYREAAQHSPASGELIFLDRDADGVCDQAGIVEAAEAAGTEEDAQPVIQMIAGAVEGRVDRVEVDPEEITVLGYALLPPQSEEAEPQLHFHTAADGTQTQVVFAGGTAVPEDAALTVTPIPEDDQQYTAMAEQVRSLLTEPPKALTLLDISFYDTDGGYLSVSDTAQVTLHLDGNAFGGDPVKVFHFTDDGPVELKNVTITSTATLAVDEETGSIQTQLTFETEGFSIFAVVLLESSTNYEEVNAVAPENLAGSYYIFCRSAEHSIGNTLHSDSALAYNAGTYDSLWTLTQVSENTYTIQSDGKYMVMNEESGALTLTTDATSASVFTAALTGGKYTFYANGYYINEFGGHGNMNGFKGYKVNGDNGNNLTLYREVENTTGTTVNDLDGKSFAIVSNASNVAMTTTEKGVNKVSGLAPQSVTLTAVDGVTYVEGNVPLWTFEKTSTSGVYNISIQVNGTKQYLTFLESYYEGNTNVSKGSLTLSDTPQDITVLANSDGTVYLTHTDDYGHTGYVNRDGDTGTFWVYNGTNNSKLLLCDIISGFSIPYGGYTLTVHYKDNEGNDLYASVPQVPTPAEGSTLSFADIAKTIKFDGYTYSHALLVDDDTRVEVESIKYLNSETAPFRFYEPGGTDDNGNYYTRGSATLHFIYTPSTDSYLLYDLNAPNRTDWINQPYLSSMMQPIDTAGSQLLKVESTDANTPIPEGSFVCNTLSMQVRQNVSNYFRSENEKSLASAEGLTQSNFLAPGKEYRFKGWQATVDGETYTFAADAIATVVGDSIQITDTTGQVRDLPFGTRLTGIWEDYCDAIMFFVNYSDTMLENEDKKKITNHGNDYYVQEVVIGHIFHPTDDPAQYDPTDYGDVIDKAVDEKIQAEITEKYKPSSETTQIVIAAAQRFNTSTNAFEFVRVYNYNQGQLEADVAAYLRANTNTSTQIKIGNTYIDRSAITSENYKIYWYLQQPISSDANVWHVDGVLVARTQPMEIYKTFSGLSRTEAQTAINSMKFPLYLIHQDSSSNDVAGYYTYLEASGSSAGIYSNDGWQGADNIYKWTLESIQGQRYAFQELGYTVADKDCSRLVSVHYTDGRIVYEYSTDATATGLPDAIPSDLTIANKYNITDKFASPTENKLIGGNVKSVIFANFYTDTGTGMFSISKVDSTNTNNRLSGAVFTLTKDDDSSFKQEVTTNSNGAAHFANLDAGTYTLQETSPPTGYVELDTQWTVTVTKTSSDADTVDNVTVTIQEQGSDTEPTTLYDRNNGGILDVYQVQNTPEKQTITVTKYFSGITQTHLTELKAITGDDRYCIEVKEANGTFTQTLVLPTGTTTTEESSSTIIGEPITGDMGYTWTITVPVDANGNVEALDYTFTEKNFLHDAYLETVVSARFNSTAVSNITRDKDNETASFTVTKSTEQADSVEITNDYTDTFQLRLAKVDSTTGKALVGAQFKIYSESFNDQTSTEEAPITFTDADGKEQTAYYVGITAPSDEDGIAVFNGSLKLAPENGTFYYVINEVLTPDGYITLEKPLVHSVRVSSESYDNGVFQLSVPNTSVDNADITVTVTKVWKVPWDMDSAALPAVTLNLYRKTDATDPELVGSITLDGTDSNTEDDLTGWQYRWSGLPYSIAGKDAHHLYEYYVAEAALPGYRTDYDTALETLTVDGSTVQAAQAVGSAQARSLTVTNTTDLELPATGGGGTTLYTFGGLLILLSAAAILMYNHKSVERRRPYSPDTQHGTSIHQKNI